MLGQPLDGSFDRGLAGEGLAARDAEKRRLLLDPGVGSRFVVLGLNGLIALCRVLESWINNFLAVEVAIEAVETIRDERWSWHVGLDSEADAILSDLYEGIDVDEDRLGRLLSLCRLEFRDPTLMRATLAGRPVYLGMAMTAAGALRLKPQNPLDHLPLAATA